jgi:acyl-CoA synthetase (AMP-forming)/AMP-acid ligase II
MNRPGRWLVLLLCFSSATWALDPADLAKNTTYIAMGQINLRATPPSGLFYSLGAIIGVINRGDKVLIKEISLIKTLLGKHYWAKIEKTDPVTHKTISGWIYVGDPGNKSILEKAP